MFGVLALLFIAVPIAETVVLIEVGGSLGALTTIAIIVLTGITGAALARHQGIAIVRELSRSVAEMRPVGRPLAEAALVLAAAVAMLTPGFITDTLGLALLVPLLRRPVAGWITAWASARVTRIDVGPGRYGPGDPPAGSGDIIDI